MRLCSSHYHSPDYSFPINKIQKTTTTTPEHNYYIGVMEYLMAMQFVGDNDLLATQSDTPTNQPIQQPQAVGMPIPQSLSGGVEAGSYEPISEEI